MKDQTSWLLVWLIWLAGLGAAAQYGKMSVVFDQLPQVYPDAGATLGFVVSLVGAVGIALGVAVSVLVAQIGYRRALLSALILGGALSLLQAVWPPLPMLLATRVLEGIAHLLIVVSAPTLIAETSAARHRGATLTLWGSFFGVSFALLAYLGLPLVEAFGLHALMLAHGVYMLVMAALLWPLLPRVEASQTSVVWRQVLSAHWRIYSSPRIGAPALGWLFYTFCFLSALTVLPPFLDPGVRVAVLAAMPLLSIIVSLTLGVFLLRSLSAVQVVLVGFAACLVSCGCLWLAPGAAWPALMLGGSLGLVQGATFASVPELNELAEARALANGGLAQMGNLGNTLGTPVMLLVIGGAGYGGFVGLMALVFAFGLLAHLLSARARRP